MSVVAGVAAAVLAVGAGPAAGSAVASARVVVSAKPALVQPSAMVRVSGRVGGVRGSTKSLRVLAEEKSGRRWVSRAQGRLGARLVFALQWRSPSAAGARTMRLRLVRRRKTLATSSRWTLTVTTPQPGAQLGPPAGGAPVATPAPSPAVTPAPASPAPAQTAVIAPAAVLRAPQPGAVGTLRLAGEVAVAPGDVLASGISDAAPYGFLVKARSVARAGGETVVEVEPATLQQAIPEAEFSRQFSFSGAGGAAGGKGQSARRRFSAVGRCESGGEVVIDGSAGIDGMLEFEAGWGPFRGTHAEAAASVTASANALASASGNASCSVGPIKILETKLSPVTFVIVGVPVVVVPELEIELSGSGEVSASVDTSVNASVTARAGAKYEDGELSPIAELDKHFTWDPPEPEAAAKLAATLSAELEASVYGVGGPELTVNGGLEFGADLNAEPWWWLDAPISVTAGFEVDALGLEAGPITVFEKKFRLAEAPSREPQYRVIAGELHAVGSQSGGCTVAQGYPCEPPIPGGWTKSAYTETQADDARFTVASPSRYQPAGDFAAAANIESWAHSYTNRTVYGSSPCLNPGSYTIEDQGIRHPGGTHPSIYSLIGEIKPAAPGDHPGRPKVALRRSSGDFGNWTLNQHYLGIGWPYSNGKESLVGSRYTQTASGGGCEPVTSESEAILLGRYPFDPLYLGKIWGPAPTTTPFAAPVTYGEPRCIKNTCVIRVSGVDGFDDVGEASLNRRSSVRMTWWFDVETCWGTCTD